MRPPPQWGSRVRRTKWPGRQHKESREVGRSLMKREKYRAKNRPMRNKFCDFDKPRKHAYQKGKIESKEQSKEGGQLK